MGGTNDQSNIVELTIAEHADAHNLLYCLHGKYQDKQAERLLLNWDTFEESQKGMLDYGRTLAWESSKKPKSVEHRKKLSESKLGVPVHSKEHKLKLSKRMTENNPSTWKSVKEKRREFFKNNNPVHTPEGLESMRRGVIKSRSVKHKCLYCDKLVDMANLKRWHNNNCKHKEA